MSIIFGAIFLLLAMNVALWGGLSLRAPQGSIEGMPYLVILIFSLHLAAYVGWLYFKVVKRPTTTENT